jgi:hypothetical protein
MISLLLVLMALFATIPVPATAQPAATPADTVATIEARSDVEIEFPTGIAIDADLSWTGDESGDLELLLNIAGDETSTLVAVPADVPGTGEAVPVETVVDLQSQFVPAGIEITFRWRIVNETGTIAESEPESAAWHDTRWDWQEIESEQVRLHYYDIDTAFAEKVLESAQVTISDMETRYRLERTVPIEIWIYPSSSDFQEAKQPNSRETIAGLSYPDYSLITAVIPDGNDGEIGRVIPHEVSHLVLFQATENPFAYPPLWFNEGMATHFQVGGTDGFMEMVTNAHIQGTLFDLNSLEISFPFLPAQATLAYATSWSAYEYIEQTYGDDGIAALIEAFGFGVPYDEALITALGVDGSQLNDDWLAWVASQAA